MPNKSRNPEKPQKIIATGWKLFNYCAHGWRVFAEDVLQVVLFTVLWFKWLVKKYCVAKFSLVIWEIFLHENNRNYNSCIFSDKFAFIPFLSLLAFQKQESSFQQVGGLVTKNISVYGELRFTSTSCWIQ